MPFFCSDVLEVLSGVGNRFPIPISLSEENDDGFGVCLCSSKSIVRFHGSERSDANSSPSPYISPSKSPSSPPENALLEQVLADLHVA